MIRQRHHDRWASWDLEKGTQHPSFPASYSKVPNRRNGWKRPGGHVQSWRQSDSTCPPGRVQQVPAHARLDVCSYFIVQRCLAQGHREQWPAHARWGVCDRCLHIHWGVYNVPAHVHWGVSFIFCVSSIRKFRVAVQEAPGQVPAGAPRRVSMEDLSFSPGS